MFWFQPFQPTIEDIYDANVSTDRGTVENLRFYDTEGLEPTNSKNLTERLPKHLLAVADGVVIVYSIDDESSFQIADVIRKEAEKHKEKKDVRFFIPLN
jgi:NF-kappa-B inhibitor-interacting Ras-like protein